MSEVMQDLTQDQPPTDANLEGMSLGDLRQAAIDAFDGQQSTVPTGEQPRDEKGRFASKDDSADAAPDAQNNQADDDAPDTLFRRVIDIGDGAGPEVFEAESLEGLIDKIADAKGHASRKIREQQKELNTLKQAAPTADSSGLSQDEEFILSQELLSHPSKAIKKLFKETTGYSIEEFATVKTRMDAMDQAQAKDKAVSTFLQSHPDFVDGPKNSKVLTMALKDQAITSENLHKAYLDLKESGLLDLKDESADGGQDDSSSNTMRIAEATQSNIPPQRTRKASGISTQNRTQPPARRTELTEEELENLPLDKLRELAMQAM